MLGKGIAREQARMVLPQNLYTRFYYTANMHGIYHFWKLRADEHAQWEIRVYAEAIGDIMQQLFPVSWGALTDV
jgi:thymidylate synthase (FAD)